MKRMERRPRQGGQIGTEERRPRQGGQMIALFALVSTVLILATGLVIDGGYAFAQRRES